MQANITFATIAIVAILAAICVAGYWIGLSVASGSSTFDTVDGDR